jgi:hypothetical protein
MPEDVSCLLLTSYSSFINGIRLLLVISHHLDIVHRYDMAFPTGITVRYSPCSRSSDPYSTNSSAGFLGPAPIPITAYNSTNGTFCVTSVLTQLSAYFGTNLTIPYITSIFSRSNSTASSLFSGISTTVLCNDCIFAAVDVVERAYPSVGDASVSSVVGALGVNSSLAMSNMTLNGLLNSTCAYENLTASTSE